jgi:hypothetical protein
MLFRAQHCMLLKLHFSKLHRPPCASRKAAEADMDAAMYCDPNQYAWSCGDWGNCTDDLDQKRSHQRSAAVVMAVADAAATASLACVKPCKLHLAV